MRSLGDIERFDLGEYLGMPSLKGVTIGVVHKGPRALKHFTYSIQQLRFDEMRRILKAREGLTKELAPTLFSDSELFVTPEGQEAFANLTEQILKEYIVEVGNLPTLKPGHSLEQAVDELIRFDMAQLLVPKCMEVQSLDGALTFSIADIVNAANTTVNATEPST